MRRITTLLAPLLAILAALAVCTAFVALSGQSPLEAGTALVKGAAGSKFRLAESLAKTIPLVLTGLGVTVAFRAGFFNIGAEGQFLMGALFATAIATRGGAFSKVTFVLLAGILAGGAWALVAGWLKLKRGAPEIISTIMLNYIALQCIAFAVQGPLQETTGGQPQSDVLPKAAQLPTLIEDTNLHIGLFIALLCAVALWWLLFHTERGFLMRASGENPIAASVAGIPVGKNALLAIALSGALCGLGGAMEIAGATRQLGQGGFGYGYTAIAVALLGRLHPLAILPAALFFGMLSAGGGAMERSAGVPAVTVSIVTGVVIFVVAALPRLLRRN
jgi:simple sugar transport system permease protein